MNPFRRSFGRLFSGIGKFAEGHINAESKASAVGKYLGGSPGTAWLGLGAPQWTSRTYESMTREGYRKNAVAYRCIRIIADSAAAVPLNLFRGDHLLTGHPVIDLMARPNPLQSGQEMLEAAYAFLQIAGNSYMEVVETALGQPGELYILRPDRMTVVPGPSGWPARYDYKIAGHTHGFPVDQKSGQSQILHLRNFNPLDDHYGQSPLEAAAFSVDLHNGAQNWNKSLLDNAARPSGALVFEPRDGLSGNLSEEQFQRLKDELDENYQGAQNAGRPFLLEGGLKWQQIALSPQDMDFIESKHMSSREIALAFGVPPMILGIPGDNTYANYVEANRALWRLTLLPLVEKMVAALNCWLLPRFEADLRLDIDRDAIPALTHDRDALWKRIGEADFLTDAEKRRALGLPVNAEAHSQASQSDESEPDEQ